MECVLFCAKLNKCAGIVERQLMECALFGV